MPLSEHEQRLLEQIEQALYAEDPKFASLYRATDLRSHYRNRVIRSAVLFLVGLGLLLAGVVTAIVEMGVAGFLVMLAAASWLVASLQRMNSRQLSAVPDPGAPAPAPVAARSAAGHSWWKPRRPGAGWRNQAQPGQVRATRARRRSSGPKRSIISRLEERFQHRFDR